MKGTDLEGWACGGGCVVGWERVLGLGDGCVVGWETFLGCPGLFPEEGVPSKDIKSK